MVYRNTLHKRTTAASIPCGWQQRCLREDIVANIISPVLGKNQLGSCCECTL